MLRSLYLLIGLTVGSAGLESTPDEVDGNHDELGLARDLEVSATISNATSGDEAPTASADDVEVDEEVKVQADTRGRAWSKEPAEKNKRITTNGVGFAQVYGENWFDYMEKARVKAALQANQPESRETQAESQRT